MNPKPLHGESVEPERYEFFEAPRYRFRLNRRAFIQTVGAGLLVSAYGGAAFAQGRRGQSRAPRTLDARIHIGEDGNVTVLTGKVEVGQGSRTQLTQAAAEELRIPLDRVRLIMADTARVPNDGGTYGSLTTPRTVPAVRQAAAAARDVLLAAASATWNVPKEAVALREGRVVNTQSKATLSFGELAQSQAVSDSFQSELSGESKVTPVEDWQVLGTPAARTDGRDIVTGAHAYPSDITRPGMLYGKVLRPPSFGARLTMIDLAKAEKMEGVITARDGDFVGFAAPTTHEARKALEAVASSARWEQEEHPSSKDLAAILKQASLESGAGRRRPRGRTRGSVEEGLAIAKSTHRAVYHVPYIQHAPMEPRAATAEWNNGNLTVWTGTQRPNGVRSELARAFGLKREQVRVIVPDTGGGFGGKHTGDAALEAANLALGAKRPVAVRWTREEEFTWAYFRPAGVIEVNAGLDRDGRILAWEFTNINSGASALESPYAIPNTQTKFIFCDSPLREGSYRSLAATANTFARESFIDELALLSNTDPVEFRLNQLENTRMRAVLEAAAKAFDFTARRKNAAAGIGVGMACGTDKGSFVAACAEVDVRPGVARMKVNRLCQAFECGAIMNPLNLRSQVEGCIIMGLGGALTEAIHFENGAITNASFKQYEVPRFKDIPEIEIVLVDRPDLPSAGAGETPIIGVAPAIANAVLHATGRPLHALPLRTAGRVTESRGRRLGLAPK